MSIKKNLISNFILSGTSILFPVIIFPYVIRTLSPANYGRVAFVDAITQYITYYSVTVLGIMLNGAVNFWYFLKNFYKRGNNKLNLSRHFKPLLVLFSMSFSVSVYTLFDSIILGMLKSPTDVSMYTVPL